MEPFVDRHREEIIRKVTKVDPILDDLKDLLKKEDYEFLKSRQTSKEKMEALFGYVSGWNDSYKDRLYELLKKHDGEIIRDLEKQERDTDTSDEDTDTSDEDKGTLLGSSNIRFQGIRRGIPRGSSYPGTLLGSSNIRLGGTLLGPSNIQWRGKVTPGGELTEKKHFVYRYQRELIQRIHLIDPILDDLMTRSLLTSEQCDRIRANPTPQDKMRRLYSVIGRWSNTDKDILYNILKKHNSSVIGDLEKRVYGISHKPGSSLDVTSVRWKGDGHSGTQSQAFCSESFQSPGEVLKILPEEASSSSHLDEIDCDLCGKDHDPDDTLVFPDINGKSYRLELTSAGLFRCSEMGIKFQVKGPVTIEYELDSWDNYIAYLQHQGSEVLGPLFNIKTPQEPHIVCAVYLPHYLCFKEQSEDTSWIRCAHFIDGNMSVEKPTRILPFHVVLENPSFSSLGVFCWNALPSAVTKRIPIHGRVLLYFRVIGKTSEEYQLHLYLVPRFAPISKDHEKEKQEMGYVKVDKPPRTRRTIYTEKKYIVKGPDEAFIDPKELDVRCISPKENFTDITIDAAVKTFGLDLVQEDSEDRVWGCHMSTGTIEQLWSDWEKNKRPKDQKESVDEHQRQPIEVSLDHEGSSCRDLLMSILDDMKDQSFKAFKACLNDGEFLRPHRKIPCADLEHADRLKVADLLVRHYTEEKAPNVTVRILEAIKEANLAKELRSKIGVK